MTFRIYFETVNAAFDDDPAPEVARILRTTAVLVGAGDTEGKVVDANGNTVGTWGLGDDS